MAMRNIRVIGDLSQTAARSKRYIEKSEWFFGGAMNIVPAAESSDLGFEPPLPDEYFPLWRCIACGAMGNSNPCMGVCDYHKLEVVRSVEYAELLDEATVIMEHLKKLTALARRIAGLPEEESERENSYRVLRDCARNLLREINPTGKAQQNRVTEPAEALRVWLCRACGQIEAPQTCLGVCIRPIEEYVRAKHYSELMEQAAAAAGRAQKLRALVARLAWVSPRPGQWRRASRAFQDEALAVLEAPQAASVPSSPAQELPGQS
jgi:hypothetical protein